MNFLALSGEVQAGLYLSLLKAVPFTSSEGSSRWLPFGELVSITIGGRWGGGEGATGASCPEERVASSRVFWRVRCGGVYMDGCYYRNSVTENPFIIISRTTTHHARAPDRQTVNSKL